VVVGELLQQAACTNMLMESFGRKEGSVRIVHLAHVAGTGQWGAGCGLCCFDSWFDTSWFPSWKFQQVLQGVLQAAHSHRCSKCPVVFVHAGVPACRKPCGKGHQMVTAQVTPSGLTGGYLAQSTQTRWLYFVVLHANK
jgi:hypothetical protein